MLYIEYRKSFFVVLTASFFLFLFSSVSHSQTDEKAIALFILKGNTILLNKEPVEGVDMELKKDGKTITKIISEKKGRYQLQMNVSTNNPKNSYTLYISKEGTVPKTLSINTYIPPEEFKQFSIGRFYGFELEIKMIETTVRDIVDERPAGKIQWDINKHEFAFDQTYAKIRQKEEEKMKEDPDKYFRELAEKKKKEQEEIAKKKAAVAAESKRLADQKAKEEANRIIQKNMEAMKQEMKRKRIQDSLNNLNARNEEKTTVEIKKFVKPILPDDVAPNAFDGTGTYSINTAKNSLKATQDKTNKKKAANLSAKYETNNTLTSLLNMVDEHDKKRKKQ